MSAYELETLVDSLPDAVVVIDADGAVAFANNAAERLFGWSRTERVGTSALDLVHPDDVDLAALAITSVAGKEVGTPLELRVKSTGGWLLVELVGAPLRRSDDDGHVVLSIRDLTDRRRWEVTAGDDAMLRALIQNGAALTVLVGPDGIVRSASAALTRSVGHDVEHIIGMPIAEIVVGRHRQTLAQCLEVATQNRAAPSNERRISCEVELIHSDGRSIPFQLSIVDLVDDPTVGGLIVTGQDVTELHRTRVELAHTATHDALTGLPNRAAITGHITDILNATSGGQAPAELAVVFVDLDRFKPVNDLFGHDAGDELLIAVAARLQAALRDGDAVGRFGGDEFVVVASTRDLSEALSLGDRLEAVLSAPFRLTCGTVQIYASVGVAVAEVTSTTDELLTEADAAMYSVKHGRRGSPRNSHHSIEQRQSMATAVEQAFARDEFVVHYQPILDVRSGSTEAYEVLVRWKHPDLGLLMPSQFLDVIAALGSEARLGNIVLRTAMRDLSRIDAAGSGQPRLSVNVTASEVSDPEFGAYVSRTLAEGGISPDRLAVEVSERALLERSNRGPSTPILAGMFALNQIGVSVIVDDFGTGYSSLSHLVSFPIDGIKIDRSFISGIVHDDHRRTIVSALIALASGMNMGFVAEGIETAEQERIVRELGCNTVQGFLYGKPAPIDAVIASCNPAKGSDPLKRG